MNNYKTLLAALFAAALPAFAGWLAEGTFPAEILFGTYTTLGLFVLAAFSAPQAKPLSTGSRNRNWIRNSFRGHTTTRTAAHSL